TCYETFGQREAPCPWCLAPEVWATGKPQHLQVRALDIISDAHWRPVAPDLYLHFAFDITERKRMDAELMQAEKLAAMGTMIAGVAHELNNPLASVVGIGQLLAEKEKNLSPQGREGVRIILDAANQCRHVVQNLTTFAKKEKPEKKTVDIKEILHAGVDLMRPVLKTDRIEIQEDYPRTPLWARVSPQAIEQVVVNIITNAAEAMRPNGPGGILKIRARVAGGNIRVEMEDNGPGIDEPERIFEPFYSTKDWGKGTGLGLSVSHNIVAAHGGTLTAANTHTGAMFKIMLPRAEAGNSRKA
ncbi:MAG: ATP-binding protein, partial [Planctomycetia bacterium]|nr:ATP-binding protein [Planctomycetia bacterium]